MDPQATNYESSANVNDGSCIYPTTNGSLEIKGTLPGELNEISGMIHINGKLYALNDGGNSNELFVVDTLTRNIEKTITLEGATNVDWEDLTTDGTYIYIGDFGNNAHGNRTDLKIYRVPVQSIAAIEGTTGTVPAGDIDVIHFSYEDQTDFTSQPGNHTAFDCEAVLYDNGKLHLFTKNWIGNTTSHYTVPAEPGDYVAEKRGSFDTGGVLVTSATKANNKIVILLGYIVGGAYPCSIWMISGFSEMDQLFTDGNKRKIDIGSAGSIGQVESITAVKPTRVLISNEYTYREVEIPPLAPFVFEVQQSLYGLNTDAWTPQYVLPLGIANFNSRLSNSQVVLTWEYSDQEFAYFEVEAAGRVDGTYRSIGKIYRTGNTSIFSFTDPEPLVSDQRFYRIRIVSPEGKYVYSKTLAVRDSSSTQFNLTVAPNPFKDKLDISFYSDKRQTVRFSISDLQGRTVALKQLQCTPGRYSYIIDGLQGLSQGVYFLKTQTAENTFVRKLVR
ncbi:MAG: T9SS type A sorting domain-containing protein [Chitinophagaceae bacterium]|nr:T9SS type A sorting domain-containing protein [Chitinophagaceae bacterium]